MFSNRAKQFLEIKLLWGKRPKRENHSHTHGNFDLLTEQHIQMKLNLHIKWHLRSSLRGNERNPEVAHSQEAKVRVVMPDKGAKGMLT